MVVLPRGWTRDLGIKTGDYVELFVVAKGHIMIRKVGATPPLAIKYP